MNFMIKTHGILWVFLGSRASLFLRLWKVSKIYNNLDFYNNLIHGKGKYIYPDGKIYEGNFQNGLKHGFGKISWNENKYFEGFWINNRQHGEGKYFLNGKILNAIFRYGKLIMKIG